MPALRLLCIAGTSLAGLLALPSPLLELLKHPAAVMSWWEVHGSARAAATVLQLVAVVFCSYLVVLALVVVLATWCRAAVVQRAALRWAFPRLRRSLTAGVAAGLLTVSAAHGAEPERATVRDLGPARSVAAESAFSDRLADIGPASPLPPPDAGDLGQQAPAMVVHEPPPVVHEPPPVDHEPPPVVHEPPRAAPAVYEVQTGDNLWAIAVRIQSTVTEAQPATTDVVRYWSALIDLNRDQLSDPDLIVPGQRLRLPPIAGFGQLSSGSPSATPPKAPNGA